MVYNSFPREEVEIKVVPKTTKSFTLILTLGQSKQIDTFSAANVKGVTGTYKLAKMIARL